MIRAPIQSKVNSPELKSDFEEFCRRMRLKWHFRNAPEIQNSNNTSFYCKSTWKPPTGHHNLEVFLNIVRREVFSIVEKPLGYSNLTKDEWNALRALADDRNLVIKKVDKGSGVVVWDRNDYII